MNKVLKSEAEKTIRFGYMLLFSVLTALTGFLIKKNFSDIMFF